VGLKRREVEEWRDVALESVECRLDGGNYLRMVSRSRDKCNEQKNRVLLKGDQPVTNVSRYLSGDYDMEYLKNVCKILVEFRMGDLCWQFVENVTCGKLRKKCKCSLNTDNNMVEVELGCVCGKAKIMVRNGSQNDAA